jgi:Fe2+ or Zn2+ uptake regulation protein
MNSNQPVQTNQVQDDPVLWALREAGLRVTSQRVSLLNVLRAQGGFLDAETLFRLANTEGANLSLATVYRTLALFKEMNLIEGRIVGDEQEREEYRFRSLGEHYTLTCRRCGTIVPVEPDIIEAFRREVSAALGVTVLGAHSCFIGYCAACTAELAAEDENG